ncbi:MAG: hypothetical protein JRC86_00525 [Deltaproteobacteria bacterium]|nr:hypothetical protein [Deltaproteobacteria bacterium]
MEYEPENDNCLMGMRCPNPDCKSEGPFMIKMSCWGEVYDSGVSDTYDNEWDNDSNIQCVMCSESGRVADFKE